MLWYTLGHSMHWISLGITSYTLSQPISNIQNVLYPRGRFLHRCLHGHVWHISTQINWFLLQSQTKYSIFLDEGVGSWNYINWTFITHHMRHTHNWKSDISGSILDLFQAWPWSHVFFDRSDQHKCGLHVWCLFQGMHYARIQQYTR